ncbi:hypothetical protein [Nitrobacter winogradskyi]|uniref:hypothetical protein n=1 Tax=Nitrobacter winogradskyi TaxID=913 RepID=UPI0002F2D881|nr:hypothetical protein [Nitrobacter winogradskyi]
MNVIDSNILERDAGGKPLHTFPHPALERFSSEADTGSREENASNQNLGASLLIPPEAKGLQGFLHSAG